MAFLLAFGAIEALAGLGVVTAVVAAVHYLRQPSPGEARPLQLGDERDQFFDLEAQSFSSAAAGDANCSSGQQWGPPGPGPAAGTNDNNGNPPSSVVDLQNENEWLR